jgi:hypothetical protein
VFYVQSRTKYIERCKTYQQTGVSQPDTHLVQATFNEFDELEKVQFGRLATQLDRGQLVQVLQAIDTNEDIEISTGGF